MLILGGLIAAAPLVEFFLAGIVMFYPSYDTTPWTGAVSGTALVVAGVAFWFALARPSTGGEERG